MPATKYGDSDFSEDTWSPGSSAPPPPSFATPPPQTQYPQAAGYGTSSTAQMPFGRGQHQYANMGQGLQSGQAPSQNPIVAMTQTITQEDILFMRTWQRDSFYYRVIPMEVLGLGGMYMYNRTKNLPHKIPRYLAMAAVAFMFGKWTYRGEFKRRLAESPMNTPYMQTMRRSLGIEPPVSSEFSTDPNFAYGGSGVPSHNTGFDQWSGSGGSGLASGILADDSQFGSGGLASPMTSYDSTSPLDRLDNQTNDETAKPRVTYDELRARNRGFIK